jgi:hypothetical protein
MSTRERLIVAAVSAFAIALGAGYILLSSQPPSADNGSSEAAPAVNEPLPAAEPAGS